MQVIIFVLVFGISFTQEATAQNEFVAKAGLTGGLFPHFLDDSKKVDGTLCGNYFILKVVPAEKDIPKKETLTFFTLHNVKGLEFRVVEISVESRLVQIMRDESNDPPSYRILRTSSTGVQPVVEVNLSSEEIKLLTCLR